VGSLLEVGTGFHPELTGRENVYLNGAILGMHRTEINKRFDEIVAFAEIEKFLDTPVKRYSSGMYVRLAFAVAAHLEPEILLVDEVLAVGDAAFQKKCLGKMGDVAGIGRTVLFVSHNMNAIQSLCRHSIWLQGGRLHLVGPSADLVAGYLGQSLTTETERVWSDPYGSPGTEAVRLHSMRLQVVEKNLVPLTVRTPFEIELTYSCSRHAMELDFTIGFSPKTVFALSIQVLLAPRHNAIESVNRDYTSRRPIFREIFLTMASTGSNSLSWRNQPRCLRVSKMLWCWMCKTQ